MTARRYPPRSSAFYDPETELPRPVIGLDIDGTIGEYHDHFLRFASGWFGKEMLLGYDGSTSLASWMGVSKKRYRECKLAYRRGGLKRSMPVIPGAAEFAAGVRKRGAKLIICTTRPFLMLENVDPDTREWLRRNRIQYDAILHGEHKYRDLRRQYGSAVIMVHEDLPDLIKQADENNCHPVMAVRPHNEQFSQNGTPSAHTLEAALQVALTRIFLYESERA